MSHISGFLIMLLGRGDFSLESTCYETLWTWTIFIFFFFYFLFLLFSDFIGILFFFSFLLSNDEEARDKEGHMV